jgi:hypothetical protein
MNAKAFQEAFFRHNLDPYLNRMIEGCYTSRNVSFPENQADIFVAELKRRGFVVTRADFGAATYQIKCPMDAPVAPFPIGSFGANTLANNWKETKSDMNEWRDKADDFSKVIQKQREDGMVL